MNLSYIFEHGDGVLITTFLILISMSLVSWYIIFWKAWKIRKERQLLEAFKAQYIISADWPKHAQIEEVSGSLAALIRQTAKTSAVLGGYDKAEQKEILGMQLAQTLDNIRAWLDKGLTVLASVGSSAPFIGLFGTVWGIYGALTKIAVAGNASLNVVAGPMGEALVATAVGLFAAIPAVLAYNAFVRVNRILVQDLRHIAEQLAMYLAQDGKTKKASGSLKLVAGE